MKPKELREKTEKELQELLNENRRKLGELKFSLSFKKLKNVSEVQTRKRDIARIITVLKERK